jgi:hypothetical protein
MTDERIDALIRRLDLPADADSAFTESTFAMLLPIARRARQADRRPLGRWRGAFRLLGAQAFRPVTGTMRSMVYVAVVVALVVALLVTIVLIGALRPSDLSRNGVLIVSVGGELQALDVDANGGAARAILTDGSKLIGVSRSPDGRLVSFWTGSGGGTRLDVIGVDGANRRQLSSDLVIVRRGCVDAWSTDSRWLAADVEVAGVASILVVDVATGVGHLLGPPSDVPECPLWSPDGHWLAFAQVAADATRTLAIINADGTGYRRITGDLDGLEVSGPNSWSPDGTWIYFDAKQGNRGRIYRSNVVTGASEQLTGDSLAAFAPTLSPDVASVSFIARGAGQWYDLWAMQADGSGAHRVLDHATNNGWSSDGAHILSEWHAAAAGPNGALVVVGPEGGSPRVLLSFPRDCEHNIAHPCLDGFGWGQPTP